MESKDSKNSIQKIKRNYVQDDFAKIRTIIDQNNPTITHHVDKATNKRWNEYKRKYQVDPTTNELHFFSEDKKKKSGRWLKVLETSEDQEREIFKIHDITHSSRNHVVTEICKRFYFHKITEIVVELVGETFFCFCFLFFVPL